MASGPEYLSSAAKRTHDIASAALFMPALGVAWLPMQAFSRRYCDDGEPYILKQRRVGKDNGPLDVFKFRTLHERAVRAEPTPPQNVVDRRTDVAGNIVRILGLDEIAQLVNVWQGDMSMVGPRPLLRRDVRNFVREARDKKLAQEWRSTRALAKPGIVGPGQFYAHRNQMVNDPDSRDIQMRKDIEYVETASLAGDIALLAKVPHEMFKLGRLAIQSRLDIAAIAEA
jgi:lipopolysaccharide/colanic/teichoic acid biosynthesis glycosyltransferase